MPKLKHYAIATGVVSVFLVFVGAVVWLAKAYPAQFWIVIGALLVATVIFCFAANYAEQDRIMKGDDQ